MALSRERMIDRMMASDGQYNGRFIIGVLTTGIYCLPSCHARKPKPENVRFFKSGAEARTAGLRACKLCKPDQFEIGRDFDLERLEDVAAKVQAEPGKFETVEAVADLACVSPSTLHQQFREHFQVSPGTFLNRARIEAACRLLREGPEDAGLVGLKVGFESVSGFYESFRKSTGMTPANYKNLGSSDHFEIALPDGFPLEEFLKTLSRDPDSVSERISGCRYAVAYSVSGRPQLLQMEFDGSHAHCILEGDDGFAAHQTATRILNLRQEPASFERQAAEAGFERLYAGREGLRIPQTTTAFEGLIWVVLGQQVNFRFAAAMRRRLTELVGRKAGDLFCVPEASDVAALDAADLLPLQFSRQKADYLLGIARTIADGSLDIESMSRQSATSVEKRLRGVRGLGVWSVNYLMMRTFGFADCVPLGDTGISSGVKNLFELDHRPKPDECDRLLKKFSPYRSLACYHLWRGWSRGA